MTVHGIIMQPHPKADLLVEFDGFLKGFYLVLVLSSNVLFHESLLELFGHPQHLDIADLFSQVFHLHVKLLKLPGGERGERGEGRGERGEDGRKNVDHSAKYTCSNTHQSCTWIPFLKSIHSVMLLSLASPSVCKQ